MKVFYIFPAAATVLLLLSGCSKAIDYIRNHPDEALQECQVQTLQVYSDNSGTVNIDYNSAGNPVDMLYHFFDSTGPATPTNFSYDRNGNLVIPDVTYDSTVNPYRTNAVWMFVFQNYSVNNPHAQSEYGPFINYTDLNAFGLPQEVTTTVPIPEGYLFSYLYDQLNITYACSCTAPSLKGQPAGGL